MKKGPRSFRYVINLFIFFNVCLISASAQNSRLDSLLNLVNSLPEDTNKTNTLYEIGRTYLKDFNNLEKVGEYGWKELSLARKLNHKKGIAQAMSNIAITYNTVSVNYDLALYYNRTALKLAQEIGDKKLQSTALANMGVSFLGKGDNSKALEYLQRSQEIKRAIGDKRAIAALDNNMAVIYKRQGNFTKAMSLQIDALKLMEEVGDPAGIVTACCNVGALLILQQRSDEALSYYLKAIQIRETENVFGQTVVYGNIGTIYLQKKQFQKALMYMLKELAINKQIEDKQGIALAYMDIASVYTEQNRPDVALDYQLKSYSLFKEIGDKSALIRIVGPIAKSYILKKDFKSSMSYSVTMLALCKETGDKESMEGAYANLASVYKQQKQFEKALEYTEAYHTVKDSLLNKENFKQVTELNTRYETEKKEKEILLLTKDQQLNAKIIRQQQLVRWGLIGGLGLLCISIFSIYRRYRFKQKANIILEKQKREIQQKNTLITDSIDYAKTIQEALLPDANEVKNLLPQSFILNKPKDIVSGDFYWITNRHDYLMCAVADCTGHGVPGAFMSLLGYNILENVVQNSSTKSPAAILDMLD